MDWRNVLLIISPYVFAAVPGIWLVAAILRWAPVPKNLRSQIDKHLPLSGWIGLFERWLVIFLIGQGEWSALGFIIAAKGLLRMPEIRREAAGDSDVVHILSSYVLLGTLISLTLAIVLAELPTWLRCLICS
ncbi:MAG: hypothetical protein NT025_04460 [bacterium]|nr:hypothetical protein [bacterium]